MDELRQQIRVLADEVNTIRAEIVQSKQAHAGLHQATVDDRQRLSTIEGAMDRVRKLADNVDGNGRFEKPKKPRRKSDEE